MPNEYPVWISETILTRQKKRKHTHTHSLRSFEPPAPQYPQVTQTRSSYDDSCPWPRPPEAESRRGNNHETRSFSSVTVSKQNHHGPKERRRELETLSSREKWGGWVHRIPGEKGAERSAEQESKCPHAAFRPTKTRPGAACTYSTRWSPRGCDSSGDTHCGEWINQSMGGECGCQASKPLGGKDKACWDDQRQHRKVRVLHEKNNR